MSTQPIDEESQEIVETEADFVDEAPEEEQQPNADAAVIEDVAQNNAQEGPVKKKREKKEAVPFIRDSGKSLLPFSRVQKIIKADKEIPIIARDATFLISLAAEEFIKRLCQAGQRAAQKERRTTVQHKDLATVIRKADEFMFLGEIITLTQPEPQEKRAPKALTASTIPTGPTLLDAFIKANAPKLGPEQSQDVIMNDNGSMTAGAPE
ncbi:hypothetical protein BT96DRAFT_918327 [Gymnopus androsaceus JB14]|uniref:Transcription factor CBF/NF-Y/archaeal histone domain-containing protein n=1 Tax=Gymnopus androsaceus JB14 TaxID=1447944 RepID=A0A6A4HZE8_9AGAR|nr:hypothetical protein BT96DRAFT_918327 [Gymnopus androsaceus JB14]